MAQIGTTVIVHPNVTTTALVFVHGMLRGIGYPLESTLVPSCRSRRLARKSPFARRVKCRLRRIRRRLPRFFASDGPKRHKNANGPQIA